ncbi:MAG: ADP-glucose pyrophosphorylase [Gammaproteobacteria bacterium RIFCSPLOWO2_12_47_11]|nr:MAG: ADP-glucose pyrophosphorylase [Gammaproteobacteria bacterium RIFCSPLOWO2_12_47_11]
MKTVLLAAGIGQRLSEISGNKPKCLLQFGGVSLLQRHLKILHHYGITGIIIVTGYRADLIEQEVGKSEAANLIQLIYNPAYEKGSIISMLTGVEALAADNDFLLMDADVLYDHRIIERLISTGNKNCFLLDRDFEPGEEPVKLCVRNGRLIEFRKKIDDNLHFDYQGESVGFFRFSKETADGLVQSAKDYLQRGEDKQPYEECIRDLLLSSPDSFGFEDITGLNWIEIDFPEDLDKAKNNILPNILQLK